MAIEVEIRAFIDAQQYARLKAFFEQECGASIEDRQETHYFEAPVDLRIQQNDAESKLIIKGGKLHDISRKEIEVRCRRDDFANLQDAMATLGYAVKIKWFRTRYAFEWDGITATLDNTTGHGHILELEKLTEEDGREEALVLLRQKLAELGIEETSPEEMKRRFSHYAQHWRELTGA